MIDDKKPTRSIDQQEISKRSEVPDMYLQKGLSLYFGGESNANYIDVVSLGPIESFDELLINETNSNSDEFPLSEFHTHTGDGPDTPFLGNFPYVERTYGINKQANIVEGSNRNISRTNFVREVSGIGVEGVRVNFTTSGFTQRDTKGRRKDAWANFKVEVLDENDQVVTSKSNGGKNRFFSSNPMTLGVTVIPPESYRNKIWKFRVSMNIMTNNYSVAVSGNWTASTVTEFYRDTQTYENIAYCSGKIVASDVSGSIPTREYIVKGYKVDTPVLNQGLFLGQFDKNYSTNPAWNGMAPLVDTLWGAGLPFDKMNITSWYEFSKYCDEVLQDGTKRYTHSQQLIKKDNYYRIASQIVGTADGKLFEDTSGRIGVLIDKQEDKRRIVTSYDILDEKVKRTTVPERTKINYVQAEFPDKTNLFNKTIVSTQDDEAIIKNGLVKEELKLDTSTEPKEVKRIIDKVLVTSQVASTSYVFTLGHNNEDLQVGEVIELYDRKYSRSNYCGKVGPQGFSDGILHIDPRTPIDIDGIENPVLVLDNNREVPEQYTITSWTNTSIEIDGQLTDIKPFTSFGIKSSSDGLQPTLVRVLGVTFNSGRLEVEGVEYNHSLYSHVENGTDLIIPTTRIIPDVDDNPVTGLSLTKTDTGLLASWNPQDGKTFNFYWRSRVNNVVKNLGGSTTENTSTELPFPLEPASYDFYIYTYDENTGVLSKITSTTYRLGVVDNESSKLQSPQNVGVARDGGVFGTYFGREFSISWEQPELTGVEISGFLMKLVQDGNELIRYLGPEERITTFSEKDLRDVFGEYKREFLVRISTFDGNLNTTAPTLRTVTNEVPPVPDILVDQVGLITLKEKLNQTIPDDVIGSSIYIWKSSNPNSQRPSDAVNINSQNIKEILIPDDVVEYDAQPYVFEAAWVDTFGKEELTYERTSVTFLPQELVPLPPELTEVVPKDETTALLRFNHDGTYLKKMKVVYRQVGYDTWIEPEKVYTFPVESGATNRGYDLETGEGFLVVTGLPIDTEMEFAAKAANDESVYSELSNILVGSALTSVDIDGIIDEIDSFLGDIDIRDLISEGVVSAFTDLDLDKAVIQETTNRVHGDQELTAAYTQFRAEFQDEQTQVTAQFQQLTTLVSDNEQATAQRFELLEARFESFENEVVADFQQVTQLIATNEQATAQRFESLTATVNGNSANITTNQKAITDESSARAAAILSVESSIGDTNATVQSLANTVATEDEALSQRINSVTSSLVDEVSEREADVSRLDQAIVDESGARASADTQLSARISSNSTEIATVSSSAKAAIGYCMIGGSPSGHDNKTSCQAAGGSWVESPLAEAVLNVQVNSGGQASTVGQFYSSYVDLSGELVGRATIGVNSGGGFTGVDIIGSSQSYSKIKFTADVFELENSSGSRSLYYETGDNTWIFSGNLNAVGGVFSGNLNAAGGSFEGEFNVDIENGGKFQVAGNRAVQVINSAGQMTAAIYAEGSGVFETLRASGTEGTGGTFWGGNIGVSGYGARNSTSLPYSGVGVSGIGSIGVTGQASSSGTWAFYATQGNYGPFTGGHEGLVKKEILLEEGDILCDEDLVNISNISNAICSMGLSKKPKQRSVRGVFTKRSKLSDFRPASLRNYKGFEKYLQYRDTHDLVHFNALGEGVMNVCGEGGDLEAGDYICSSSLEGKGMKQEDQDFERPYTIAQARHTVIFDTPNQIKQVAVIYLRG